MNPEKLSGAPEKATNAERRSLLVNRISADARADVFKEQFGMPAPATPEQQELIQKEAGDIAALCNAYGKPWFYAGGTSLELAEGTITRDHQDSDIAFFEEDVADFVAHTRTLGYIITDHERKEIPLDEEIIKERRNVFLHKSHGATSGPGGFEIIFLRKNATGAITFDSDARLSFPASLYENAQTYSAQNSEKVPLQSKEIVLIHKLFDGRQKDVYDITKFLPTLSEEERQRLDGYLKTVDATFMVGATETDDLDELLQLVETQTGEVKEAFFASKADKVISENVYRFDAALERVFVLAEQAQTPKDFLDAIIKEFGTELLKEREIEFNKATEFFFGMSKPTEEVFKEYMYQTFNLQQQLEKELKKEILDVCRWELHTRG